MATLTPSCPAQVAPSLPAGTAAVAAGERPAGFWREQWPKLAWGLLVFAACFALPLGWGRFDRAVFEALALTKWYAQEHVLLCLVPAFFIAGAIAVFVSQASVMKYLGPNAPKPVAYGVASVSGSILAVCSCTVLPLFAGIWRLGAGLGPAVAFLYAGPAINVLAIILTARVLGLELGIARAVGAVSFSIVIGAIMHLIYRREEQARARLAADQPEPEVQRPLGQNALFFGAMVGVLVFANWGKGTEESGFWYTVWQLKWPITALFALALGAMLVRWLRVPWWKVGLVGMATAGAWALARGWLLPRYGAWLPGADHGLPWGAMLPFAVGAVGLSAVLSLGRRPQEEEARAWFAQSWGFARQITPLLLVGVLVSGFLLGRPDHEGLIPNRWVVSCVGANTLPSNLFASVVGAFMYFATLTEVPILQGLMGSGMHKGPALTLLLAGPALSLPSMLVIRSVMGTQKTVVYVTLVVVLATLSGWFYGAWF